MNEFDWFLIVQTRRYAVVLLLVTIGGLITQLSADDRKTEDKRHLENEWASTAKKDHNVREKKSDK